MDTAVERPTLGMADPVAESEVDISCAWYSADAGAGYTNAVSDNV